MHGTPNPATVSIRTAANARDIPTNMAERLIVALDVPSPDDAKELIKKLDGIVSFYKIGLWLLFTGTTTIFDQFGVNGFLSPALAVWSPLVLFSMLGIYLLSKVRT